MYYTYIQPSWYLDDCLHHHGIKGQKWGVRRYQNYDGTITSKGKQKKGLTDKQKKILKTAAITGAAFAGVALAAYGGRTAFQYLGQSKIAKAEIMRFIKHQAMLEGSFYRKPSEGAIKANIRSETKNRFNLVRNGINPDSHSVDAKPSDYGFEKWERVGEASSYNSKNFDKFNNKGKAIKPLEENYDEWLKRMLGKK